MADVKRIDIGVKETGAGDHIARLGHAIRYPVRRNDGMTRGVFRIILFSIGIAFFFISLGEPHNPVPTSVTRSSKVGNGDLTGYLCDRRLQWRF